MPPDLTPMEQAALLKRPVADIIVPRSYESWARDDAWHRAVFAPTAELRALWESRLTAMVGK